VQHIAACPRRNAIASQQLAQLRGIHLEGLDSRLGRGLLPERIDETIERDDVIRVEQE